MVSLRENFIEQMRQARESLDINQETLGKMMSVSRITVNRWENGERVPDLDTVEKIAKALNKKAVITLKDNSDSEKEENKVSQETKELCLMAEKLDCDARKHIRGLIEILSKK